MQAISIRSVSYLTIDGKVGALIERDTDVVPGRYKLGYDREGTPIIFAKQLVAGLARRTDAWPPFYDFAT